MVKFHRNPKYIFSIFSEYTDRYSSEIQRKQCFLENISQVKTESIFWISMKLHQLVCLVSKKSPVEFGQCFRCFRYRAFIHPCPKCHVRNPKSSRTLNVTLRIQSIALERKHRGLLVTREIAKRALISRMMEKIHDLY